MAFKRLNISCGIVEWRQGGVPPPFCLHSVVCSLLERLYLFRDWDFACKWSPTRAVHTLCYLIHGWRKKETKQSEKRQVRRRVSGSEYELTGHADLQVVRSVAHEQVAGALVVRILHGLEASLLKRIKGWRVESIAVRKRWLKLCTTYHVLDVNVRTFLEQVLHELIVTLLDGQMQGSAAAL